MEMDIGVDGCIDWVGADIDNVGVQLPTFFSLFFQKCAKFRKKTNWANIGLVKFGQPNVSPVWIFFEISGFFEKKSEKKLAIVHQQYHYQHQLSLCIRLQQFPFPCPTFAILNLEFWNFEKRGSTYAKKWLLKES